MQEVELYFIVLYIVYPFFERNIFDAIFMNEGYQVYIRIVLSKHT